MRTFRFTIEDDSTVDVRGDTIVCHKDINGLLDFITVIVYYPDGEAVVGVFPSTVIMYAVNVEHEDDPGAMEPEPMNKECDRDCQCGECE